MTIDYNTEYDTRGRVPDHLAILGRMAEDARNYRAAAVAAGRADLDMSYGPSPRQIVDIFWSNAGMNAPVAVFIHGGYWRALQPSAFSQVAGGLNGHGVTVALVGYDLCPQVSIGAIVKEIQQACVFLWQRLGKRLLVHGHSAGGHLTGCCFSTDWEKFGAPKDLVRAAMGISGLYDLAPMVETAMNADFKLDAAEARRVSPLFWPAPTQGVFDAVVGGAESDEFFRQSRTIVDAWGKTGVTTRYDAPAGANHFTVIQPLADPNSAMVKRLVELLPKN
jgi:arylformamidase